MNPEEIKPEKGKKSFWNTTIGVIAKVTALITALTALIIAFRNFNNAVHPNSSQSSGTATHKSDTQTNNTGGNTVPVDTGHLIKPPEEKKPDIRISAFSISPSEITLDEDAKPKALTVSLEALNNGNAVAENCAFTLTLDGGEIRNYSSESFSLNPNTTKQVVINATVSHSGNITAKLSCSNDTEKLSSPVPVTVYNYGTVHHIFPKIP